MGSPMRNINKKQHLKSNSTSNRKKKSNKPPRRRSKSNKKGKVAFPNVAAFKNDQQTEQAQSRKLDNVLHELELYDTEEGLQDRKEVLDCLESILNIWIEKFEPPSEDQRARCALVPFGSYCLGVHKPKSDLDVLAIAPPAVSRNDFFSSLVPLLMEHAQVEEVHPLPAAYTPVVKCSVRGISVDLLFCALKDATKLKQHEESSHYYPIDDSDLVDLDEASVRSLNGARVAQIILETAPNQRSFRMALRAIKEWAHVQGLYSNVLGYLGGINYAILVAAICKKHRNATPATLIKAFFQTYGQWAWPNPVQLGPIDYATPQNANQLHVWHPQDPRDSYHLMPIITPAYPSMNSSYNVGVAQLRNLTSQFRSANKMIKDIEKGKKKWSDLFRTNHFFKKNFLYLQVNILSPNSDLHTIWFRYVTSKMRFLITGLEQAPGVEPRPFGQFFHRSYDAKGAPLGQGKSDADNKHETCFFIALLFSNQLENIDLAPHVAEFLNTVNTWSGRKRGMDLTIEVVQRHDLPDFLLAEPQKVTTDASDKDDSNDGDNNAKDDSDTEDETEEEAEPDEEKQDGDNDDQEEHEEQEEEEQKKQPQHQLDDAILKSSDITQDQGQQHQEEGQTEMDNQEEKGDIPDIVSLCDSDAWTIDEIGSVTHQAATDVVTWTEPPTSFSSTCISCSDSVTESTLPTSCSPSVFSSEAAMSSFEFSTCSEQGSEEQAEPAQSKAVSWAEIARKPKTFRPKRRPSLDAAAFYAAAFAA